MGRGGGEEGLSEEKKYVPDKQKIVISNKYGKNAFMHLNIIDIKHTEENKVCFPCEIIENNFLPEI